MFRKSNHMKALATGVAAIALAVPATASASVDLRNPDNRVPEPQAQAQVDLRNPDNRVPEPQAQAQVDLRSPDTRVQSPPAPAARQGYVDLRSPDSREGGRPAETLTTATQPRDTGEFSWGDAAIGAGVAFGLLMIGLSGLIAVTRRRGHGATA